MIHNLIIQRIRDVLEQELITNVPVNDNARAGIVKIGELQGDPDPDEARISVTIFHTDPDNFTTGTLSGMKSQFMDEIIEAEVGGTVYWKRTFTIKARVLLERTQESFDTSHEIFSMVKYRIEKAILGLQLGDITYDREKVVMSVIPGELQSEVYQSGGPPNEYDYFIKVRFAVMTMKY